MKKSKITIIIAVLFLFGVFSVTLSFGDFFLATKYYTTSLDAYNADSTYSAIYGDTKAKREVGVFMLDEENALFIGEVDENRFVVAEMDVRKSRYAFKGTTYFYNLKEPTDILNKNQTSTLKRQTWWNVVYDLSETEKVSNILSIEDYTLSCGDVVYLLIYE